MVRLMGGEAAGGSGNNVGVVCNAPEWNMCIAPGATPDDSSGTCADSLLFGTGAFAPDP